MSRSSIPVLLLVVVTAVGADRARACGPDFPPTLLADRPSVLHELPDGPFDEAMRHLVDGLMPDEPRAFVVVEEEPPEARSQGSTAERALYDAGATAFTAHDHAEAVGLFRQLLALPVAERQSRSTWAAFMLGRLEEDLDEHGTSRWWSETRALAANGFDDALGLAAASFGEEARRHRDAMWRPIGHGVDDTVAAVTLHYEARRDLDAMGRPIGHGGGDIVAAVTLYGRQARLGSPSGALSLLQVTRAVLDDDDGARRFALLQTVIGRRLFAAYAFARGDERPVALAPVIEALRRPLAGDDRLPWGDHLAAALYRQGRVDDATAVLAMTEPTALALWVQAKLALRRGDLDEARALLARSSTAFPHVEPRPARADDEDFDVDAGWWHPMARTPGARVLGERAVLSLARGEYGQALAQLLESDSWWQDAAQIAERVLTVDELLQFVEQHAADPVTVVDDSWGAPRDARGALRALLARRLVREGRSAEAVRFFDDARLKAQLASFNAAMAIAHGADHDDHDDVARAEALFAAAAIVRSAGLELRGTELAPDFFIWGGAYDTSIGWDDDGNEVVRAPEPLVSSLVGVDEVRRSVTARPAPNQRFHHRFVAGHIAEDAARLVPTTTQAYAALLCQASRWSRRDPAEVRRIWNLYVATGPPIDFTNAFGADDAPCPAPDFAAARARVADDERRAVQELLLHSACAALPVLLVAAVWLLLRRRRRLSFSGSP